MEKTNSVKAKRHKNKNSIINNGITNNSIKRLAKRGGVKRISAKIFQIVRETLREFLKNILRDSMVYADYARRKTIVPTDILYSLKRKGKHLFSYFNKK